MTKPTKKKSERLTVESLKYYVPIYQLGKEAEDSILEGNLTIENHNHLNTQSRLKVFALKRITDLAAPLITSEINKILATSTLDKNKELFNVIYYAGLRGMEKGLLLFDESKMNKSATNYLMQWFNAYAKRELASEEAPFGVAASRFTKYKKISAVRKKMTEENDEEPTNEEIYEYFQSGQADIKNLHGKVGSSNKPSKANRDITLELIEEQEEFEQKFLYTVSVDVSEDYTVTEKFSENDESIFDETVFGAFIKENNFSNNSKIVIMSELQQNLTPEQELVLSRITDSEYKEILLAWRKLIKDPKGKFYQFLLKVKDMEFDEIDVSATLKMIEAKDKDSKIRKSNYDILFNENSKETLNV